MIQIQAYMKFYHIGVAGNYPGGLELGIGKTHYRILTTEASVCCILEAFGLTARHFILIGSFTAGGFKVFFSYSGIQCISSGSLTGHTVEKKRVC